MVPETFSLTIEKLGAQGDGIGNHDGQPVFVPLTVPGDDVTVSVKEKKRGGIYAELVSIDKPSALRGEPVCQHFGSCGGCQLQHLNDALYQNWIKERLLMALSQHGLDDVPVSSPVITSVGSRRRVALKALKTAAGVLIGFSEKNSHRVIDIQECAVTLPVITALLPHLRTLLADLLPKRGLGTLHITQTAVGLDVLIDAMAKLDLAARERLVAFANQHDLAALHWQNDSFLDPIAIRREPVMRFGGVNVPLPPASFVQASTEGENALVQAVVAACEGYGRVADLFCGLGTFTFPLAEAHQVLAVEGAKGALDSLESGRNASQRMGPKLKQIVSKHRDLFRRPLTPKELEGFDVVVIDPPRAGAVEQMKNIASSHVKRVVAVSCNPNTFARDARLLVDGGFVFESLLPVDQFLWSSHLELVGVFTRA